MAPTFPRGRVVKPPPFPAESGLPHPQGRLYAVRPGASQQPPARPAGPVQVDPVLAGFDRIVALGSYVLLFVSPFTFGVPALAAFALAIFHRQDAHPVARGHYRFQIRVFLTACLFLVLGLACMVLGGGILIDRVVRLMETYARQLAELAGGSTGARQALMASGLVISGVIFLGLAFVWTLLASAFGFLRLIANRPIGHGET